MPVAARREPSPVPVTPIAGPSSGDPEYDDFSGPASSAGLSESYNTSVSLLKPREPAAVPVDLRPPMRVLEQGEILLSDDPEQVRVLIEHNIKLKGTITGRLSGEALSGCAVWRESIYTMILIAASHILVDSLLPMFGSVRLL